MAAPYIYEHATFCLHEIFLTNKVVNGPIEFIARLKYEKKIEKGVFLPRDVQVLFPIT